MRLTTVLLVAASLLVAACTTTTTLATITSRYADPTGDTVAPAAGTEWDFTQLTTERIDNPAGGGYDTLRIRMTFAQPVVLPAAGSSPGPAAGDLGFVVHFDTDQSTATGLANVCGGAGVDFLVHGNQASLANGNYEIQDVASTVTGEATPSVSGNVLTVDVPLSALSDDGATNAQAIANEGGTWTDCAPDEGGAVITRVKQADPRGFVRP